MIHDFPQFPVICLTFQKREYLGMLLYVIITDWCQRDVSDKQAIYIVCDRNIIPEGMLPYIWNSMLPTPYTN